MIWIDWAVFAARVVLIGGAIVSSGLVFVSLLHGIRTAWLGWGALACVGAALGFLLQAAALTGTLNGAWDMTMLALLWSTPQGTAVLLHLVGAFILIGAAVISVKGIATVGALILLSGFTVTGHVTDLNIAALRVALLVHLVVAAYWVGVLGPLAHMARARPDDAAQLGLQFGRVAAFAIPVLAALGAVLAYSLVDSVSQLITTAYGRMLALKVALVIGMLVLGAMNKMRFIPELVANKPGAAGNLRRSVVIEGWVAVVVLIATASFSTVAGLT